MTASDDAGTAPGDSGLPEATPRPGTVHPRLARERALKVLFQADVRGVDPRVVLTALDADPDALRLLDELEPDEEQVAGDEDLQVELTRRARIPLDGYTHELVEGVAVRRHAIDELIEDVAEHWTVARMPMVDRNILRLAVFELTGEDTPAAVVLDEAVSLARGFGGERTPSFVNGVLETIRRAVVRGEVELPEDETPPDPDLTDDLDDVDASPVAHEPDDDTTLDQAEPADETAWSAALDLLDEAPQEPSSADVGGDDTEDDGTDVLDRPETVPLASDDADDSADGDPLW